MRRGTGEVKVKPPSQEGEVGSHEDLNSSYSVHNMTNMNLGTVPSHDYLQPPPFYVSRKWQAVPVMTTTGLIE